MVNAITLFNYQLVKSYTIILINYYNTKIIVMEVVSPYWLSLIP